MMNIEERINIEASPEEIFGYLVDIDNRKEYIPALDEVIMLDPLPIKKGSRYIEVANIAGRKLNMTYEVTNFEINKQLTAKTLESIFPIQANLSLDKKEGFTTLSIQLEFKLSGMFRVASGIVSGIVRKQAEDILSKVKRNIESSQSD